MTPIPPSDTHLPDTTEAAVGRTRPDASDVGETLRSDFRGVATSPMWSGGGEATVVVVVPKDNTVQSVGKKRGLVGFVL